MSLLSPKLTIEEDFLFIDYNESDELPVEVRVAYQELVQEIKLIMYHEGNNSYTRRVFFVNSTEEFLDYISAMRLVLEQFPENVYFDIYYPTILTDHEGNKSINSFSIGNLLIQNDGVTEIGSWRSTFLFEEDISTCIIQGDITNPIELKKMVSTVLTGVTEIEEAVQRLKEIINRATFLNTSISFDPEESVPLVVARYIFGAHFVNYICGKYGRKVLDHKGKGRITVSTRNLLELYIKNKTN